MSERTDHAGADYRRNPSLCTEERDVYDCQPVNFCFVGPRGVGKSSLLTSMYHELEERRSLELFRIDPTTDLGQRTRARLAEARRQMLAMLEESAPYTTAELGLGLSGDVDQSSIYEFTGTSRVHDHSLIGRWFGKSEKEFRFPFRFIDMPGGWYRRDKTEATTLARVKELLEQSVVSFLAIDTPALMTDDTLHREYNKVSAISSWYETSLEVLSRRQHVVVMVLSRCERYWSEKRRMIERLRISYGELIRKLKEVGVKVYVTYVKTLGGMEFETYETIQRGQLQVKVARFIRVGGYTPENCMAPLEIALRHGLLATLQRLATARSHNIFISLGAKLNLNNFNLAIQAAENLIEQLSSAASPNNEAPYIEL